MIILTVSPAIVPFNTQMTKDTEVGKHANLFQLIYFKC